MMKKAALLEEGDVYVINGRKYIVVYRYSDDCYYENDLITWIDENGRAGNMIPSYKQEVDVIGKGRAEVSIVML